MAHIPLPIVSLERYLGFESGSSEKHEFIDGYMVAMAGGSSAHSTITVNVSTAITRRMDDSPCRPFSSDMRVRVDEGSTWVYPTSS